MKFRESALSITAVLATALIIFALASTSPVASDAMAEGSVGGGPCPRDTVGDTLDGPIGSDDSDDKSVLDEFLEVLDEIF